MNKTFKDTLTVMGGVFIITLILNSFTSIEFYNSKATIFYLVFALVYFIVRYFTKK